MPVEGRAGTRVPHGWGVPVYGGGVRGRRIHGLWVPRLGLLQLGGERSRFLYRARAAVTLAAEVWDAVADRARWVEVVDHERNECWRVPASCVRAHGFRYDAGIGPRVGVPERCFIVVDADGQVVTLPRCPDATAGNASGGPEGPMGEAVGGAP